MPSTRLWTELATVTILAPGRIVSSKVPIECEVAEMIDCEMHLEPVLREARCQPNAGVVHKNIDRAAPAFELLGGLAHMVQRRQVQVQELRRPTLRT